MSKLQRTYYALSQTWHYRHQLKCLATDPTWHAHEVTSLTADFLQAQNITHLALDFDGVLAPHGALEPLPQVVEWLKTLTAQFPEKCVYILSNKPAPEREAWFAEYFPQIHFIKNVRKKPYPDGLQKILEHADIKPAQLMLVDDRLLTGMLAVVIVGVHGLWIIKAYRDHRCGRVTDCFFRAIRALEKILFKR